MNTAADHLPNFEQFIQWLHDALRQLYDTSYLQNHPLTELLCGDHEPLERGRCLRRLLLDTIHALKPDAGIPAQAPDWRAYRILELRFIEGMNAAEAMNELALSRSQFFRDQAKILTICAEKLWAQIRKQPLHMARSARTPPPLQLTTLQDEMLPKFELLLLSAFLAELQPILMRLALLHHVEIRVNSPVEDLPFWSNRVLLRQVIIHLVNILIMYSDDQVIDIESCCQAIQTSIHLSTRVQADEVSTLPEHQTVLESCKLLMQHMNGQITCHQQGDRLKMTLDWTQEHPHRLLVIDDNSEYSNLIRRYLVGYGWTVDGARSGHEARDLLLQAQPDIILLDVIMPDEDGWEFLLFLKSHHVYKRIPIIVCSVFENQQTAEALGAASFLAKPVEQHILLKTLRRYTASD